MGQQVTHILEQTFPGMNVELNEVSGGRLHGTVIWDGFDDKDMVDRQQLIRKALKEALGVQFQEVGVLLAYTPHEMSAMQAA